MEILAMRNPLYLSLGVLSIASAVTAQVYVNDNATGLNNGTSWANAYKDLQSAMGATTEIRIAEGVYRPSVRSQPLVPRTETFALPPVDISGGWLGVETSGSPPLGQARLTILDGDIGVLNNASDNAYHVVTMIPPPFGAIFRLSRCLVRNGNADLTGTMDGRGGGILADGAANPAFVVLNRVTIATNQAEWGGGLFARDLYQIHLEACKVQQNNADLGGGIYLLSNDLTAIWSTVIGDNYATTDGGGVFIADEGNTGNNFYINENGSVDSEATTRFTNCLIHGNVADQKGGGIYLGFTSLGGYPLVGVASLVNCTMVTNAADDGDALCYDSTGFGYQIRNTIIWDNSLSNLITAISGPGYIGFSDVQGTVPSGGGYPSNFGLAPVFVGATNWRLTSTSPCLNSGSYPAIAGWTLELDGLARIANGVVDLGCYERQ
jgi:hypothetical protein